MLVEDLKALIEDLPNGYDIDFRADGTIVVSDPAGDVDDDVTFLLQSLSRDGY